MSKQKSGRVTSHNRYQFTTEDRRRGGTVSGKRAINHLPLYVRTQIVLLYARGKSYGQIAQHLNESGLTTVNDAIFRRETVKRLLKRLTAIEQPEA